MTKESILCAGLLAASLFGQQPAETGELPRDWRLPFRAPAQNVQPPEQLWAHLQPMWRLSRQASPDLRSFDALGIEVLADPAWQRHRDALTGKPIDDGYLSAIIRASRHAPDRAIAFYGAFLVGDPAQVFRLIEHIPGEPERAIREEAYQRAVAYLRVHLPAKVPGDLDEWRKTQVGPGGEAPPKPGAFAYSLDPMPFVALLDVADWRDQEQALWFLQRLAELRPELGGLALQIGQQRLRELVATGNPRATKAARDFVALLDPQAEGRELPDADADAGAWQEWFDAVVHDLFPPLRRISDGLYDLYPSADLDEVVEVGRRALQAGKLVTPNTTGATTSKAPYRGLRIDGLPAPLDELGLEVGVVVTAVNGAPVATAEDLLALLERHLPHQRQLFVEYVSTKGEPRAIRYRLR